jgi:DNA-directed RNA polymerase subunit RPC12/RpoP
MIGYWEKRKEVSKVTAKIYECPNCHYHFSIFQSRGIACAGCREAVFNCPMLRCPRCDYEFPIEKDEILLRKTSNFIKKDMKNFGERFC